MLLLRSKITLRYYPDFVTVILTAPFSSNVSCATCSHGTDCHAESPAGKVQCFKMAKIDPVSPFNPILSFIEESNFAKGKPTRRTKKEPLGCKYLFMCAMCVSKLEGFTQYRQLPPAYHLNHHMYTLWGLTVFITNINA